MDDKAEARDQLTLTVKRNQSTNRNERESFSFWNVMSSRNTSYLTLFVSSIAVILGLIGTICPGESEFGKKNPVCLYVMTSIFHDSELKATIWLIFIPLLIASSTVFSMNMTRHNSCNDPVQKEGNLSLWTRFWVAWVAGGDPNIKFFCILLILCPALYICFDAILYFGAEDGEQLEKWELQVLGLALSSGYAAVVALSFFMIPVSKQSVFLASFGLSPIQALSFHIWAGRVCLFCTLIHVSIFSIAYGIFGMIEGAGFFESIVKALIPARKCFEFTGIMSFEKSNESCGEEGLDRRTTATNYFDTTNSPTISPIEEQSSQDCCYGYIRNFTGFVSAVALILLTLTSLNSVRRWNYRFFYISHVITGSTMLLFAIFHFSFIALYILPSLLYYFCTTSPVLIQVIANYFLDKGCKLEQATIIGNSNGCAEMVFPKSAACSIVENRQAAPYVRICVPEISLLWYPFTVATTPHDKETKLKILFRQYGYFTSNLMKILKDESRKPPVILIDGFYYGSDWVRSSFQHDKILIVTGGIGVTPFLSMLRMLFDKINSLPSGQHIRLKKVYFHWFCRDKGLIRHVMKNHFSYFVRKCREFNLELSEDELNHLLVSIDIIVHFTGKEGGNESPFCLDETTKTDQLSTSTHTFSSNSSLSLPEISYQSTEQNFYKHSGRKSMLNPMSRGRFWWNKFERSQKKPEIYAAPTEGTPLHIAREETLTRTFPTAQGCHVEPAIFSLGIRSGFSLLFFAATFVVGIIIHGYYYKNYISVFLSAAAFRAYSTYLIIIWTILMGILFEFTNRLFFREKKVNKLQEQSIVEEGVLVEGMKTENDFDISIPFSGRMRNKIQLHLDVKNGRPQLSDVVSGVVQAQLPGAFFCGPSTLLNRVKDEIREGRQAASNGSFLNKCCFYQEEFEM